jgi:hypothetical protein
VEEPTELAARAIKEIDKLLERHTQARSHVPRLGTNLVGHFYYSSPLFYVERGFDVITMLPRPLTVQDIAKINAVSHWMNENAIVRLFAILNRCKLVGEYVKIDKAIDSWMDVDIVRRLRNKIAHGSGYDKDDPEDVKLAAAIEERFGVSLVEDAFQLDIMPVLTGLCEGCKSYAQEWLKRQVAAG